MVLHFVLPPNRPGTSSLLCRRLASHVRLTRSLLPVVLWRLGPDHQPALRCGLACCRLLHHGRWWGTARNIWSRFTHLPGTKPSGVSVFVPGGSNGVGGTPGEGYEGSVGGYIQHHQAQLALQQHSQLQQLQQLHQYQQQLLQYQQQQQVGGQRLKDRQIWRIRGEDQCGLTLFSH